VLKIIEKYNITQYDDVVEQEPEGNPYMEPVARLRRGMRGDGVRWVQIQLNAKGYNLAVDGIFGEQTEKAVRDFQARSEILVDGIVGPQTRVKLAA
jgi:peptidoglycan hydrolase-like protein with peptidoglycan-binding domain